MKLTLEKLIELGACTDGIKWFEKSKCKTLTATVRKLMREKKYTWASWILPRMLPMRDCVRYAIFAAELVLPIYEDRFPKDSRPRKAIEAAKKYLTAKTSGAAGAARDAAWDAAGDARDAAWDAAGDARDADWDAAGAAAWAARAAAWDAGDARAAAGAARDAAWDAALAAWAAAGAARDAAWDAAWAAGAAAGAAGAARAAAGAAGAEMYVKILKYGLSLAKGAKS